MRTSLLFPVILWASSLSAQVTLQINAVPANTPPGATLYVAGNFNTWNPGNPDYALTPQGGGQYRIVLNPAPGTLEFKFTRGAWASVEGNANGQYRPNRTLTYNGQPITETLTILSWEDLGGTNNSTAAPNVSVFDDDFYIPQLNRTRRIWLYLPPDYDTTAKRYPVLYMHDGQNLFDNKTALFGEWKVDESLNDLFVNGNYGCIVVGIDNGGASRLDEYSPWVNPQYGGGEGEAYVAFIAETLKPLIDSLYRTLPGRNSTGIMGSSMGGLISMYAFSERQDVFSRAGIFSPAFWFAGNNSANHVAGHPKEGDARVYFLAGGQEPASVTQNMQTVANAMITAGFGTDEQYFLVEPDGQHSEWFWAREFSDAYVWLFQGAVSSTAEPSGSTVTIYPNPVVGDWIRLAYDQALKTRQMQLFDSTGKLLRNTTLTGNQPIFVGDLQAGYYLLRIKENGKPWQVGKFVR
ncbi:MAG: alpha/beta hydrolase-fold protein [Saprospiraceae bacterium]|nr:alpha/beta hydrolase-fold protein [Saprospiraceae bacterium]